MKNILDYKKVYEFRPMHEGKLLRYNGGDWIEDDGKTYDLAFISLDEGCFWYLRIGYRENILWSWCEKGNWGAYIPKHPNGNAWHYMLRDGETTWGESWNNSIHPNEIAGNKASSYCSEKKGWASGHCLEFNITDKHILNGLVREVDSKEILTPPDTFKCMHCGNMDWKKVEVEELEAAGCYAKKKKLNCP